MTKKLKRIGIIGWPVLHSLSPLIYHHWLGDDGRYKKYEKYEKIAVKPDQLFSFISSLAKNNFLGINITVPHKHHACEIVKKLDGKIDDLAARAQSINVISVLDDGTLQASSTDGTGFWTNLKQCVPDWQAGGAAAGGGAVVLLGAGGAAAALACALTAQGVQHWRLVNRTPVHAQKLAVLMRQIDKNIKIDIIDWAQRHRALEGAHLLIQATSLGMNGKPALDLTLDLLPKSAPVADIVYQPLKTPLLVEAAARGHQVIDGLGMLIHQAAPVFELWFGQKPKITNALQKKLEKVLS